MSLIFPWKLYTFKTLLIKLIICSYMLWIFLRDNLLKTVANHQPGKPLSGMKILDVGCGGGLLTEVSHLQLSCHF